MNSISAQDIINVQIELLESPGKTLMTLHKQLIIGPASQKPIKTHLSQKMKNMFIADMKSIGTDSNANLRTLAIVILKQCFQKNPSQQILQEIKSYLYNEDLDLTLIKSISKDSPYYDLLALKNQQMKKIIVQFFHILKVGSSKSSSNLEVQSAVKKYPIALQILVIFFRTILLAFKVPQSQNYSKKISTTACYQILLQFFDIFYDKAQNLYLFRDDNLFIQNGYENSEKQFIEQIAYGVYYQSQYQYKQAIEKQNLIKNMNKGSSEQVSIENDSSIISSSAAISNIMENEETFGQNNNMEILNQDQRQLLDSPKREKGQEKQKFRQSINPFLLMLPQTNMCNSQHSSSNNENRKSSKNSKQSSKKNSNYGSRTFNLISNRSDSSIIMNGSMVDSQCDNPTPSFNQVNDEQANFCYDQSNNRSQMSLQSRSNKGIEIMSNKIKEKSQKSNNAFYNMKSSATIACPPYIRNKILKSSLMEDIQKETQRGSIQLQKETIDALGLKAQKQDENAGLDTVDTPSSNFVGLDSSQMQEQRQRKNTVFSPSKNAKFMQNNERKMMKRSQSERNSLIKLMVDDMGNQMDETQPTQPRQSLFGMNCKKLKTSIQIQDTFFNSTIRQGSRYMGPSNNTQSSYNAHRCGHSAYSCDCSISKSKKNKLSSQAVNISIQPNFKKKQVQTQHQIPKSSKFNDNFFRNLRAKRQQMQRKSPLKQDRNKSQHRSQGKSKIKNDKNFIKFSQFVHVNHPRDTSNKSRSKSNNKKVNLQHAQVSQNFKKIQSNFNEINHQKLIHDAKHNLTNKNIKLQSSLKLEDRSPLNKSSNNIVSEKKINTEYKRPEKRESVISQKPIFYSKGTMKKQQSLNMATTINNNQLDNKEIMNRKNSLKQNGVKTEENQYHEGHRNLRSYIPFKPIKQKHLSKESLKNSPNKLYSKSLAHKDNNSKEGSYKIKTALNQSLANAKRSGFGINNSRTPTNKGYGYIQSPNNTTTNNINININFNSSHSNERNKKDKNNIQSYDEISVQSVNSNYPFETNSQQKHKDHIISSINNSIGSSHKTLNSINPFSPNSSNGFGNNINIFSGFINGNQVKSRNIPIIEKNLKKPFFGKESC